MSNAAHNPKETRFVARFRGQVIGWFDTADQAQDAIDLARAEEAPEEDEMRFAVLGY